jgi:hypothetical protein
MIYRDKNITISRHSLSRYIDRLNGHNSINRYYRGENRLTFIKVKSILLFYKIVFLTEKDD